MTRSYTPADALADEQRAPQPPARPPLNGYELLASVNVGDGWVVLVDRKLPLPDRYVTGLVSSLTDPEWALGSYHRTFRDALANVATRALGEGR
jgi:hypothetical protein